MKENKDNKILKDFFIEFKKCKFILLIAALFHDVVEDKRLTLPINFFLKENKYLADLLIFAKISWLPPKIIFDDEENLIINPLFLDSFKEYISFVSPDIEVNSEGKIEDEEKLIALNLKNLKAMLMTVLINFSGIIQSWREIVLYPNEIEFIVKLVNILTQRKHWKFYTDIAKEGKYKYIVSSLNKIKQNRLSILIKLADFLDNIRWELSEKQVEKYTKYYIPFFKKIFWKHFYKLIPKAILEQVENKKILEALKS